MRLATFRTNARDEALAFVRNNQLVAVGDVSPQLPSTMGAVLEDWPLNFSLLKEAYARLTGPECGVPIANVKLLTPLPRVQSFRDSYAFRQHVETARLNRGLTMIPEFDKFPVFYFSNHRSFVGPGKVFCMPKHLDMLDFELEVAAVIAKEGINIKAKEAEDHIAGFMILNDFSARKLQMEEMMLNLGPAKGKDFATGAGPFLVTLDELENRKVAPLPGHRGSTWDLTMIARVNGIEVSRGNLKEMNFTFGEIIERCSYGVKLYAGDVIGSGTVGTGCFLELNGTGKRLNPHYREQWLRPGDVVELEVEELGILRNEIAILKL